MANEVAPRSRGWRNQAIVVVALMAGLCAGWAQAALTEVYRFYHLDAGRHFYTANEAEKQKVLDLYPRFVYEGVAFHAQTTQIAGTIPIYRFYHTVNGSHVYTGSEFEKASILANFPVYVYEEVAFYAEPSSAGGAVPLYRLYNSKLGTHFFTTNASEVASAVSAWPWFMDEGRVFYVRQASGQQGSVPNIAPNVGLSVGSTQVNVGEMIMLSANPSDPDGTISKVEYFQGSTKVGTITSPPYIYGLTASSVGTLTFSAVATDNAGLAGSSNGVSIAVVSQSAIPPPPPVGPPPVANVPPSATLNTSATMVAVGSPLTLTANAADGDGVVSRVIFYMDGVQIDQDTSSPFSAVFVPQAAGTFFFSAVAVDNQSAQTSSNSIMVVVSAGSPGAPNTPPIASLASSTANLSVGGFALLTATTSDPDGSVVKVDFYEGANLAGVSTVPPFTNTFSPSAAGTYSFKAVATDNLGAKTTSNVVAISVSPASASNNPPAIALTASPSSVASGVSSQLVAITGDSDGAIANVRFFDGTILLAQVDTPPFVYGFASAVVGTHRVSAVATDDKGAATTSNTVTVTVTASAANQPPTVTLGASPVSVSTGATSTLTAVANDVDGSIVKVVFYNGATMLGQVTQVPYTYAFSSVVAGSYSLTAVAVDNLGAQTATAAVVVTVTGPGGGGNKSPTVTLTASPVSVTVGSPTTLTATAADADGTISSVVFMNGTTVLSTDTTGPSYTFSYTPAAAGTYSLTAVAVDPETKLSSS